jgi:flagellar basal body-associated protein FliL
MEPTITVSSSPSYGLAVVMLIVGLVLGASGVYYYLTMLPPKAAPEDAQPAQAAATTTDDTNPYAQVEANPYDVQVNPFE